MHALDAATIRKTSMDPRKGWSSGCRIIVLAKQPWIEPRALLPGRTLPCSLDRVTLTGGSMPVIINDQHARQVSRSRM